MHQSKLCALAPASKISRHGLATSLSTLAFWILLPPLTWEIYFVFFIYLFIYFYLGDLEDRREAAAVFWLTHILADLLIHFIDMSSN